MEWIINYFDRIIAELEEIPYEPSNKDNSSKFKTPLDLARKAKEVFETCLERDYILSITKISMMFGFVDRHSMYDYGNRHELFKIVTDAIRSVVTSYHEDKLIEMRNPTGALFMLKNLKSGYTDKIEQEITQKNINVEL